MKICAVFVVCCFVLAPVEASSINQQEKRDGGAITAGLLGAGASILTSGGGGSSNTWELPPGITISPENCWEEGQGFCPNGNCLDGERQGFLIKETTVPCSWFCFWRGHCKTQICCS